MPTTYTQVPNCEIQEQALSRPHHLSIPWSTSSITAVLSLLFNVVLVTVLLRSNGGGGLCREVLYCEFISLSLIIVT